MHVNSVRQQLCIKLIDEGANQKYFYFTVEVAVAIIDLALVCVYHEF